MAQVKIEITYNPGTETLEHALGSLLARPMTATSAQTETPKESPKEPPKKDSPKTSVESEPQDEPAPKKSAAPTKTDVRAVATALSKAGKRDELQAIFAEFGGKKLSDIQEDDYPALMEKLVAANG